jgi:hypothetical protein
VNAARVTIASLLNEGAIKRVPVDEEVVTSLLRPATTCAPLPPAPADDPEGAFQLAYDACRKSSLALVMAAGLRPKGQAAHLITFEATAVTASNFGARQIVTDAAQLRHVRHGAEYRA